MRKPEVTLENSTNVQDFFSVQDPDPRVLDVVHGASNVLFKPQTIFDEGTYQAVETHLHSGGQILIAAQHRRGWDPLLLAALLKQQDVLSPMMGNTVIPAKASIFGWPLVGSIVSRGGAIPVFRKKDVQRLPSETDEQLRIRRIGANIVSMQILVAKMNRGKHGAIFPEGTRNKATYHPDSNMVQEIHEGIWTIVRDFERPEKLMILAAGIDYGEVQMTKRHARLALSHLVEVPHSKDELLQAVSGTMQRAANMAAAKVWSPWLKTWV